MSGRAPTGRAASSAARVLIVEGQLLFAESLRICLESAGFVARLAPVDSADAVLAVARDLHPDVAIVNAVLGGGIGDGADLVETLTSLAATVLVVDGVVQPAQKATLMERGAAGFVHMASSLSELLTEVADALAGRALLSEEERRSLRVELAAARRQRSGFDRLTPREAAILAGLVEGRSVAEIALGAFVSAGTVRSQIHSILHKLEVKSQLAAVAAARRASWTPPAPPAAGAARRAG